MRAFLFAAALLASTAALASPPPKGWYGAMGGAYVVCDTADQLKAVAKASADTKGKGLVPKLNELYAKANAKGEPSCTFMPLAGPIAVGESEDLGEVYTSYGVAAHSWAVHAGTSQGEFFFLYGEPAEAPAASFDFDDSTGTRTMQGM